MLIDSYMHIGHPRFGSAEAALQTMDRWGTERAVLVLGPFCADIPQLLAAQQLAADRVRLIGVPSWGDADKREHDGMLQIGAGVIGFRVQGDQHLENPWLTTAMGEQGGWLFATDPLKSPTHTEALLQWLNDYPQAHIALPHFLKPDCSLLDSPLADALLTSERVHPIFSRQGQVGSSEQAPWHDLREWLQRVSTQCGWQRCLWGSEYPVLYWRGETIASAQTWVRELLPDLDDVDYQAFTGGNAERLFFGAPAPRATITEDDLPEDIRLAHTWSGSIPLSPTKTMQLQAGLHPRLMAAYRQRCSPEDPISFPDFCLELLAQAVEAKTTTPT
jgi:predicted TIM-barrel fold metal-dependent hydrolase